jgi:RNA polymerase sigma-70 factor (ECF subfamily)
MQVDDAELVERSRDGDLSAFNQIVQRYQSQVYNLAARILGDRAGAEDIAQETFVSAYKALARFRGGSLRAWLLRISSNLCYDQLRSAKRRSEQSLDEAMESPGFAVPSREPSPEQQALSGELRDYIQGAILGLPFDQRNTLALVDVQGLSYEEAAEAMNISLGTVKSRLSRARAAVRDALMEQKELLPDRFRQE